MMEHKEDLRVRKTYDALTAAFRELIIEKPFDKITVRELCSRANTRTATFYSHFSDKYDFFAFMMRRIIREYMKQSELTASQMEPESYISQIVQFSMDLLEQNEDLIRTIVSNSILIPILHLIAKETSAQIKQHFEIIAARGTALSADPEILTELFVGAAMQISHWWFVHRAEISKEELMEKLCGVLSKMVLK